MLSSHLSVRKRLYFGFGLILAILVVLTVVAIAKVQAINAALQAVSQEHAAIQRYAINFRGSAHDRAIAVRDVVLSSTPEQRQAEVATIEQLARFYAESAGPLEQLLKTSSNAAELRVLYGAIQSIESQAVATSKAIVSKIEAGDAEGAQRQLWNEAKPQYVAWLAAVNKLIDFEEARIQSENAIAMGEAGSFLS
ncbi:MAG: MCP four helix bundle domain-containing protein, partial [Hydrogenophaga sp.]